MDIQPVVDQHLRFRSDKMAVGRPVSRFKLMQEAIHFVAIGFRLIDALYVVDVVF